MKITIVIPSAGYAAQAGVRIRYKRIEAPLRRQGWSMNFVPIDEIKNEADLEPGVVLFSKCQDARTLALADLARTSGQIVGLDLFDDYFSQVTDARFAPQRHWLAGMSRSVDFYLTSTDRMACVARQYMPNAPGLVLSDPFSRFDARNIASGLQAKRDKCLRDRRVQILWFGIGDNPNFPVGLEDLAGQAESLRRFRQGGFEVDLKVLTNERALGAHGLALLRRLGVPFSLERWSLEAEENALRESFASFIPVNSQSFSIAKSLNRAVTALAAGNQILSSGYPLYSPLADFVYRDWSSLVADIHSDKLRVRPTTLETIAGRLNELASPEREAASLATFLAQFGSPTALERAGPIAVKSGRTAVVHGFLTNSAVHKFAQQMGWLSLGTPLTPTGLAFDAHLGFFGDEKVPALRLSKRAPKLIHPRYKRLLQSAPASLGKGGPLLITATDGGDELDVTWFRDLLVATTGERAAFRDMIMARSRRTFQQLFGELNFFESEMGASLQPAGLAHLTAEAGY